MGYAIVGYFDSISDERVKALRKGFADIGVDDYLINSANNPHIKFAMFDSIDLEFTEKELHLLSKRIEKINIHFKKYGLYPNDRPFITIDIADNIEIINLQMEIQKILNKFGNKKCTLLMYIGNLKRTIYVKLRKGKYNMKAQINLITIWTDDIDKMKGFYNQVLGFIIKNDLGNYVEFENNSVRFAICMRNVMYSYSDEYRKKAVGQAFELAFPCENPNDVDEEFKKLVTMGATPIHEPQNMPWNQRTALFADPDGNIHEIFAEII